MLKQPLILATLTTLLLSACASPQQQGMNWRHSYLTGQAAQQQNAVDSATCVSAARNAAGPRPQAPQGSVTDFSGRTSGGGYFSGQARTTPQSGMYGAPAGIQQAEAQNQWEANIANMALSCMAQRGWSWQ